jgi:hypothetical protein
MARKVNQVLWDQWRQRIERQRASGLSVVEFCRKEGVSGAAFHRWKGRLRGRTGGRQPSMAARQASRESPTSRRRGPRGVAAGRSASTRKADFFELPVRGMRSSPWIELTLADGTLIRVPQENLAALVTLLRVLRGDDSASLVGEARHA